MHVYMLDWNPREVDYNSSVYHRDMETAAGYFFSNKKIMT